MSQLVELKRVVQSYQRSLIVYAPQLILDTLNYLCLYQFANSMGTDAFLTVRRFISVGSWIAGRPP